MDWGTRWVVSGASMLAEVPSVIVPEELNILINPSYFGAMDAVRSVVKGQAAVTPTQRKADILVEPFRDLEILGRNMRLELNSFWLWQALVVAVHSLHSSEKSRRLAQIMRRLCGQRHKAQGNRPTRDPLPT